MTFARTSRIATIAAAAVMLSGTAGAYTIGRCADAGETAIDRLRIDRAKISGVKTDTLLSGGERLYVSGHNLWLKSTVCAGSLVLVLGHDCRFIDTFTRGDCTLAVFRK